MSKLLKDVKGLPFGDLTTNEYLKAMFDVQSHSHSLGEFEQLALDNGYKGSIIELIRLIG